MQIGPELTSLRDCREPRMHSVVVGDDYSITVPQWVLDALDLKAGDNLDFVKVPGEGAFILEKVEGLPTDAKNDDFSDREAD